MQQEDLPEILYHCSAFLTEPLMPGIYHTGVRVRWDRTESNEWLYATSDREAAILMGLASAIEHKYLLDRFHTEGDDIVITTPSAQLNESALHRLRIHLYLIHPKASDGWVHNHNRVNQMTTEYKTKSVLHQVKSQQVDLVHWLRSKKLAFHYVK